MLPTGGRLEWDYEIRAFPSASAPPAPNPGEGNASPFTTAVGVSQRRMVEPGPGNDVLGEWTYEADVSRFDTELSVTVTQPLGHRTKHYFSVWAEEK